MEKKGALFSALSVGLGVGMGLGLVSGETVRKLTTSAFSYGVQTGGLIEEELKHLVVSGKEINISFDKFPSYLSMDTRELLINAAFVCLNLSDVSKHIQNLTPSSRTVLISGPNEIYLQNLSKALAHEFKANLLLLDVEDFCFKICNKHGWMKKESLSKLPSSEGKVGLLPSLFSSYSTFPRTGASLCFNEKAVFQSLNKVLISISKKRPTILYFRDIQKPLQSETTYVLVQEMIRKLPQQILVLGSSVSDNNSVELDGKVSNLFSYTIVVKPPDDEANMSTWNAKQEEDMKSIHLRDKHNHIKELLAGHDLECDDLASLCGVDTNILNKHIQEIIIAAVSYHFRTNNDPEYRNGKLVMSSTSLSHGLSLLHEVKESSQKNVPDNEYERDLRLAVVSAKDIGISFDSIGAMDEIKASLQEAVMLPLQRPGLFDNGLLKPCKGVLLFGPPGTGKTMLAKAIAAEASASFINVTVSVITSEWYGNSEKNARAVFTLAAKVSPAIIFIDEVDCLLGKRNSRCEDETSRKIKNEFMAHWDGLLTKSSERILVLAATNRPFDLDESIIRRFERRIMVGLPSAESREKILLKLLEKAKVEDLNYRELATMTEGFSGSDLKNLCMTAAYRPLRELIKGENEDKLNKKDSNTDGSKAALMDTEKIEDRKNGEVKEEKAEEAKEKVDKLRPINMEDMREAKKQVATSPGEGAIMNELKQWNDMYGDGGSGKKQQLSYFL